MLKCVFAIVLLGVFMPAQKPAVSAFAARTFRFHGTGFGYRLLQPARLEPGKRYPLVLFLHGAGERGSDNEAQLRYLPERMATEQYRTAFPAFVLVPQCRSGNRWVEVDWGARASTPMQSEPSPMMAMVLGLLDATMRDLPIDPDRVYLAGASMGGFGAWELAARRPHTFAALAPICGGGDESTAALLTHLPIWAWHGSEDRVVLPERTRRMVQAVRAAGGSPKYTELPGVAHNSFVPAFAPESGLVRWMFSQRRTR